MTIDVETTAAAGLVLHLAGRGLDEPRYTNAAVQSARALAAVQLGTGQLPATGIIGANAGGRDAPRAVPSRAATCAALGLLLAVVHDNHDEDPAATANGAPRRAAIKAAHWLASQQTRWGGWLVSEPPDAPPGQGTRLVRLDGVEYRDATIALVLAAHVLEDDRLARAATAAVESLDALRMEDEKTRGFHLWSTAYTADGNLLTTIPDLAPAVDSLAARNAMQTLLAACLLGDDDDEQTVPMLREAASALARLRGANDAWRQRYDLVAPRPARQVDPAEQGEQPPVSSLFNAGGDETNNGEESEPVSGVDNVVRAADRLGELGPAAFRAALNQRLSIPGRLALVLCNLGDEALTADLPPPHEPPEGADPLRSRLRRVATLAWQISSREQGLDEEKGPGG